MLECFQILIEQRMLILSSNTGGQGTKHIDENIVSERLNENSTATLMQGMNNLTQRLLKIEVMQNTATTYQVKRVWLKSKIFGIHLHKCRLAMNTFICRPECCQLQCHLRYIDAGNNGTISGKCKRLTSSPTTIFDNPGTSTVFKQFCVIC